MKQFNHGLRRIVAYVGVGFLSACTADTSQTATTQEVEQTVSRNGCPSATIMLPIETVRQRYITGSDRYFDRFDYAPRDVVLDENTIRFLAREYDFVYCRADASWTVQPGTLGQDWAAELDARDLAQTPAPSKTQETLKHP